MRRTLSHASTAAILAIALIAGSASSVYASGTKEAPRPDGAATPTARPIRIGLMADFTGLPFLVAEQEGLFEREGVPVELSLFRSASERDAALQAGALDGCNADVISAMANSRAGFDVQIVASALNRFSLLEGPALADTARAAGRAPAPTDLAGAGIGISRNTVIEYVVDSLMEDAGVGDYRRVDVPRIPVRLELFLQGELQGASLPLPFDELAVAGGAAVVADSVSAGLDPDLFLFYRSDLAARPAAYRALWRAIDAARLLILERGDSYRSLLSGRLGFSDDQAASVAFPDFPRYAPTKRSELERAARWMLAKGLLEAEPDYDGLLATGILP